MKYMPSTQDIISDFGFTNHSLDSERCCNDNSDKTDSTTRKVKTQKVFAQANYCTWLTCKYTQANNLTQYENTHNNIRLSSWNC